MKNPADKASPVAIIATPAADALLGATAEVTGTVSDDIGIHSYTLSYAPESAMYPVIPDNPENPITYTAPASAFIESLKVLRPGNITSGVLGTFDTTLMQNGRYLLRLTVRDTSGNITTDERIVTVEHQAKIGNFSFSETDVVVPVSGIPLTVTRSYDTLNRDSYKDLGYGWRRNMGIDARESAEWRGQVPYSDADFGPGKSINLRQGGPAGGLREGVVLTAAEGPGIYYVDPSRDVWVSLPDGQRAGVGG